MSKPKSFNYAKFAAINERQTYSLREGVVAYAIPADGFIKLVGYAVNGVMVWAHKSFLKS